MSGAIRRPLALIAAGLAATAAVSGAAAPAAPPGAAPGLRVSFGELTSVPPRAGLVVVPGTTGVIGRGPLRRFAVEVERGLPVDRRAFAAAVQRILFDRRGWTGAGGLALQRVDGGRVDLRVTLARPRTVDRLCFPLHTAGVADCFNRGRAVINFARWTRGSISYGADLRDYRYYLINHEVGHGLGHAHRACPGPGRSSFVMMQQTGTTFGCRRQPWPRTAERRRPLVAPRVLVLAGGSSASAALGLLRALGAPDRRLGVDVLAGLGSLDARALRGVGAVVVAGAAPPLPPAGARAALQRFVRRGGGLLAAGAAAGPVPGWPGWSRLLGLTGAAPALAAGAPIAVRDGREPPTRLLPASFASADSLAPAAPPVRGQVLAAAGGLPVAWCRREGRGRVLADALGGGTAEWATGPQQALVAGGLAWVLELATGRRCR